MNILLSDSRDIFFQDGQMKSVTGLDEMRQKVDNCLVAFMGDWFLDLGQGVPYFQRIFVKGITKAGVTKIFNDYIAAIDGVLAVLEFKIELDKLKRTATIVTTIQTSEGILDYTKQI